MPYGCNENIDSIGNISCPGFSNVNLMNIFDNTPRRSRGHCQYISPQLHNVSINCLLPFVHKPLGLHYIRTTLYSLLLRLQSLYTTCLETLATDSYSTLCKRTAIKLDIGQHRLYKTRYDSWERKVKSSFLQLFFANKG